MDNPLTETLIERYADLLDRQEMLQQQMQELLNQIVIPQEIIDQQNAIKAEFQPMIDAVNKSITKVKTAIESNVLLIRVTVKGSRYMAVWNKGRTTWDGKLLEGFAISHPEIKAAMKTGDPSVTFRKVK